MFHLLAERIEDPKLLKTASLILGHTSIPKIKRDLQIQQVQIQ
jgi:hypothetical protein